jgi:hypothetical protein
LLEAWFAEIPEGESLDLRQRFRSPIERKHRAALFELYLHHLLVSSGYRLEFHPNVDGKQTHPDFLAYSGDAPRFYVEAITVVSSATTEAEDNRVSLVYDTLNSLESSDFYLAVRVDGAPATSPPGAQLRRDIGRWLSTLDWDAIRILYAANDFDNVPSYGWEHAGWNVVFEPIPKSPEKRGTGSVRAIGLTSPAGARRVSHDAYLKAAVTSKDRYGKLRLPFMIAVQIADEFPIDLYDVLNGLFGQETILVRRDGLQRVDRLQNGAWTSPQGPVHTTVSAAAVWSTLVPWSFASVEPIMVHNPRAENPFPKDGLPIYQHFVDLESGMVIRAPGQPIADALRLPEGWPPSITRLTPAE